MLVNTVYFAFIITNSESDGFLVVSSYTEPLPYWIGNNMAFARIMREANRGLVLDALPHVNGNCVPVDMTVNGMLMAAYRTAIDK